MMIKMVEKNASTNQGNDSEPVRKSTRMRKKHVPDVELDGEDLEIRYLVNLRNAKAAIAKKDIDDKQNLMVSKNGKQQLNSNSSKDGMTISRSKGGSHDTDCEDEEENALSSESEYGSTKKAHTKPTKDSVEPPFESKRSFSLTTRQRALLCAKDSSSASSASEIEFLNGLPLVSRKQKEKLSEAEQQQKKAEAAQKRKIQLEKAETIRKIRGQESSRMKRECKIKKRNEELTQEKVDQGKSLESSTIRWIINSSGTTVVAR